MDLLISDVSKKICLNMVCAYVYIYIHMYVCIDIYKYMYMYVYIYICGTGFKIRILKGVH